jgi:hypothetical protein
LPWAQAQGLCDTCPTLPWTGHSVPPFQLAPPACLPCLREQQAGQRGMRAREHFSFITKQRLFGTMRVKSLLFILNFSSKLKCAPSVKSTSSPSDERWGHGNGGTSWSLSPPSSPTPARAPHGNAPLVGTTAQPAANPRTAVLGSEDSLSFFSSFFSFSSFFLKDFLNQPVWRPLPFRIF